MKIRTFEAVLRIQIRTFLCPPDLHLDPLVTCTDPAPDLSIIKQKEKEKLYFCCSVTSL
jgi:hypothetical protein